MAGLRSFRGPRTIAEMLDMQDAAQALRAAGRPADEIEAALSSVRGAFDPESIAISQMLRGMNDTYSVPEVALGGLDVPAAGPMFDDMSAANRAGASYDALRSGRTLNLRNQNTPLNQIRRDDILTAAQDSIRGQQEARAAEQLAQAAAVAGAGGLAGMIADSSDRMMPSPAGISDLESVAQAPEMYADMPEELPPIEEEAPQDWRDMMMPDVGIEDPAMPDPVDPYAGRSLPPMDLMADSPSDTADLVAESRPIPDSTPRVAAPPSRPEMLTPQEINALRSQVISIRDAKTGQAMDSFYPPESEEYKAEQRAKQRYSKLRMR